MRPIRTVCPGTQQGRLPAASRSGDNRHLPRCRVVETGDKIVAGDQPGGVYATFPRLWSAPQIYDCR